MNALRTIRFATCFGAICAVGILRACLAQEGDVYRDEDSNIYCKSYFQGDVVGIHFTDSASWLASQLDPESHFHKLSKLRCLILSHHSLSIEEMRYVSSLKSVTQLKLGDMPDEIEISPRALHEIGNMIWLKELSISDEHLPAEELQFLEKLANLETLTLDSDLDDRHIEIISRQKALRHLTLRGEFTDAAVLQILTLLNLESLSLSSTKLTSRSIVSIGQNRTILNLDVGVVSPERFDTDMFLPLTEMIQLERLECTGTPLPSYAIRAITKLSRLQHLQISIANDGWPGLDALQDLKKLDSLDLQGHGAISGQMLLGLSGQPSLTRILVGRIKDNAAIDILKTLPNLKELVTGDRHDSEIAKYAKEQLAGVEIAARR